MNISLVLNSKKIKFCPLYSVTRQDDEAPPLFLHFGSYVICLKPLSQFMSALWGEFQVNFLTHWKEESGKMD